MHKTRFAYTLHIFILNVVTTSFLLVKKYIYIPILTFVITPCLNKWHCTIKR